MEQVPQIVRERLRAAAKPEVHPDSDLLAAFSEKTLGRPEQTQVLAHLAECADCRDVVAISQPEIQQVAAMAAVRRSTWSQWRMLRWGTVAASVVVVSAVLLIRQNSKETYGDYAASKPLSATVQTPQAEKHTTELDAKLQPLDTPNSAEARTRDEAPSRKLRNDDSRLALQDGGTILVGNKNEPAKGPASPLNETAAMAPPPPPPAAAKTGERVFATEEQAKQSYGYVADKVEAAPKSEAAAPAESVQIATASPSQSLNDASADLAKKTKDDQQLATRRTQAEVGAFRAKENKYALSSSNSLNSVQLGFRPSDAGWRVSDGKLMRSKDEGASWQEVEVAQNTVIRSVCAWDSDVWAGGANGALYYSTNSGASWSQVKPTSRGKALTSDVMAINFRDEKRGFLTTSDNQIWTTSDAGQNWQMVRAAKVSSSEINKKQ